MSAAHSAYSSATIASATTTARSPASRSPACEYGGGAGRLRRHQAAPAA
ncbi:hypothetical protein [Streptomyces sp. NPDC057694]